jgi:hypothetical protein
MVRMASRGSSSSKNRARSSASWRSFSSRPRDVSISIATLSPSAASSARTSISSFSPRMRLKNWRSFSRSFFFCWRACEVFWSCQTSGEARRAFRVSSSAVL